MEKGKDFYDVFKIGVELEGEFLLDENAMSEQNTDSIIEEMKHDGSLSSSNNGFLLELTTTIIKDKKDEAKFYDFLKRIEVVDEHTETTDKPLKRFAYFNRTAGTHIHISFNDEFCNSLDYLKEVDKDNYLNVFYSLEFEKYFFKKYRKQFKLGKFISRVKNNYCKPFMEVERPEVTKLIEVEERKKRADRYSWLNVFCLDDNKGIEVRIFPHLVTAKGVEEVVAFFKETFFAFWSRKTTEKKLAIIKNYYNGDKKIDRENLSLYNQMLFDAIDPYRFNSGKVSFDTMLFLDWVGKKVKK